MAGWTITCDSGGVCPAYINPDTGLATFSANTGTRDIIYTITYTDENGNCGSTTIRQPGGCSGGGGDTCTGITITGNVGTPEGTEFVNGGTLEIGGGTLYFSHSKPAPVPPGPASDAEEWISMLDCHDGSNGNPIYASHKAKTGSGSITIEIVNESNSDFLWCGKMKVYGTTNTTFYFREPSCFVCYEGQAYPHTWYCNKTNFIFMHSNDGHANGYDGEYKIYKTLSWEYPINRYAADKNNDGEWVSTDYVGGTNCNHLADENISSRKFHIYEWYQDTKTGTWHKTGTPELGPVGGTLESDPGFGTKAQSTITKITKTINGTSTDYVIDDGNTNHSYVPEITIEAGAKYTFHVTKDNNYKFNSDEMHNSDNLNMAYLNHKNQDGNHTIIPLNVNGYK